MRLEFRRLAARDIVDIEARIARESDRYARAFVLRIRKRCERLLTAPEQGRLRPDLGETLRSVVLKPYLIVYRIEGDCLTIVRVVHGARDLVKLFQR